MAVVKSNLGRWFLIPFSSTSSYGFINASLLLLLQSLPYGAGQTDLDDPQTQPGSFSAPFAVVLMILLIAFFIVAFLSLFFRRFGDETPELPVVAVGGSGRRSRRVARGLDAEVIESFPTFLYSEVKGLKIGKGALECAVCLEEFEDDETLRLMPQCSHVFHPKCIDVWLYSHSTCPVCRANLVSKPGESEVQIPDPTANPGSDPETNIAEAGVLESPDVHLINSVTWTNTNRPPRSRSTGLSGWRITRLFPRSHSTGHSLVQPGDNLDRFTLRLPEEVRDELMKAFKLNRTKSRAALPQASSSRRGYRSGSVGSERSSIFSFERLGHRRAFSLASPFSALTGSVRSTNGGGRDSESAAPQKGLFSSIKSPFDQMFQGKDDIGERSSDRLRPENQV